MDSMPYIISPGNPFQKLNRVSSGTPGVLGVSSWNPGVVTYRPVITFPGQHFEQNIQETYFKAILSHTSHLPGT